MKPLICSCVLFGLYILLKLFSKEHVRLLLSVPTTVLIVDNLAHKISPLINKLMKPLANLLGASHYHLYFISSNNKDGNTMKKIFAWDFTCTDGSMVHRYWSLVLDPEALDGKQPHGYGNGHHQHRAR